MQTELVVAKNVFQLADGTVVIADEFFHDFGDASAPFQLEVLVVAPDGSSVATTATIVVPLINSHPPRRAGYTCQFQGITKSDVPAGSRIVLPDE